jgi:hypothetical protein
VFQVIDSVQPLPLTPKPMPFTGSTQMASIGPTWDGLVSLQVYGDLAGSEVVVLPQIDDLSHHFG